MSFDRCPSPDPDCKYFERDPPGPLKNQEHGCRSDEDHIIPRRLGSTALKRAWIERPDNRQQLCRREHEERNARHNRGDESDIPEFPPKEVMRNVLRQMIKNGKMQISRGMSRQIFGEVL